MEAFFNRVWATRGPLALLLWPLSLAFGLLVAVRRWAYHAGFLKSARLSVPVIVVGNVRVGGGGKSPTVLAVVRHLHAKGLRVAVVSRGYGRSTDSTPVLEVRPDMTAHECGDEPLMLARELSSLAVPVFVGADRGRAGQAVLDAYPQTQVVVCDDGLQHLALQRDVEVVVHSASGVGNGFLLPAGPLREPWPRRADVVLDTSQCRQLADVAVNAVGESLALDMLKGRVVVAVAAIANPQVFFDMLAQKGVTLSRTVTLPDHDDFSGWTDLKKSLPPKACILCTQKDAVKLWEKDESVMAVPLILQPPPEFFEAIDRKLALALP